ncbi:cyclic nucleotide-binding domain containing protein, putative [Eimeria necatrix]|uniref:Cyclic nucleotide-binding domain containing protein, putative n=1 Tax=Eimeria necatrix TaxID=51315 RepID=U6MK07_9EIME|nr:cyclic nucleotide-binding domain containing protein, putative [Eimeria necatrix]CDJ61990.1 cyclic nucleotide-binding domain containing protein, putative [Eimeria necatrix]
MAEVEAVGAALSTVVFFSRLDEATVLLLSKCVKYEQFKSHEKVFSYGAYGDKYYLLLTGRVAVQVPVKQPGNNSSSNDSGSENNDNSEEHSSDDGDDTASSNENGKVHMLQIATLEAGAGFGEMALLEDQPRSATIVALENSEALSLDRENYQLHAMEKHREVFRRK